MDNIPPDLSKLSAPPTSNVSSSLSVLPLIFFPFGPSGPGPGLGAGAGAGAAMELAQPWSWYWTWTCP